MTHDTRRHAIAAIACAAFGDDLRTLADEMERRGLPEAWSDRLREVEHRVRTAKPGEAG